MGYVEKMEHENKKNRKVLFRMKQYMNLKESRITNIIYEISLVKAF